jgi:hypothetical protein
MAYCDHGYGRPSERPRVFLRQAQDKLTLRRTVQVRLGSNPAVRLPGGTPRLHGLAAAIHETSGLRFSTTVKS